MDPESANNKKEKQNAKPKKSPLKRLLSAFLKGFHEKWILPLYNELLPFITVGLVVLIVEKFDIVLTDNMLAVGLIYIALKKGE